MSLCGNKKLDEVKYGMHTEKGQLLYPAIDFGGLTNYRLTLGEKPKWVKLKPDLGLTTKSNVADIFSAWMAVSKLKEITPADRLELLTDLTKVLSSFPRGLEAQIRFVRLPDEKRVIVPAEAVYGKMGRYYLRNYGANGDANYAVSIHPGTGLARKKDKKATGELYMGVSESYITPNLNARNLKLEYRIVSYYRTPRRV